MTTTGWQTNPGEFPWPPPNVQVMSPLFVGALDIRWDDPAQIATGRTQTLSAATATITVSGTPRTLTAASGTISFTSTPINAGETITIDTVTLTCVHGMPVAGSDTFDGSGSTMNIAASLEEAINMGSLGGFGVVIAEATGGSVALTAGEEALRAMILLSLPRSLPSW